MPFWACNAGSLHFVFCVVLLHFDRYVMFVIHKWNPTNFEVHKRWFHSVIFKQSFCGLLVFLCSNCCRLLQQCFICVSCLYVGESKSSQRCRLAFKWVVIWQCCCRICCLLPLYACVGSSCTLELVCHVLELLKWRWVPAVIANVLVLANSSCAG
jgi:hypothetical protein